MFALGAILFELLVGTPPLPSPLRGPRALRPLTGALPIPAELAAICTQALSSDPAARPPEAGVLGEALQAWLDGARRQAQADAIVARADALAPDIACGSRAATLRRRPEPSWAH